MALHTAVEAVVTVCSQAVSQGTFYCLCETDTMFTSPLQMMNGASTKHSVDWNKAAEDLSAMGKYFEAEAPTKYVLPGNLFFLCFVEHKALPAARLMPCIFCCYLCNLQVLPESRSLCSHTVL